MFTTDFKLDSVWKDHKHFGDTCLKMLGLYLYNPKIGQKSGNILTMLHKITLQKEMQKLWQIMRI